jgi:hypothetical protein
VTCPKCRAAVPDESVFCLACGTRLAPAPAARPANGAGRAPVAVVAPPAAASGRKAYTLSFAAIPDERLRYRLARWVVERAPAHPLAEVQEELQRGVFATFLALTADEADAARQGLQGLGVAPAVIRLAPTTEGELLLTARAPRAAAASARSRGRLDWRVLAIAAAGLSLFALVVARFIGGGGF